MDGRFARIARAKFLECPRAIFFFLRKGALFFNLKSSSKVERECFCDVVKAVKLILVMPATNAVSEKEF